MKTSLLSLLSLSLSLSLVTCLAGVARAQDAPEGDVGGAAGGDLTAPALAPAGGASRVRQIDDGALATLPALLGRSGVGAISLSAGEEAFDANQAARRALLGWVRGGGIVFLHTGAARAFGFQTVPARLGSNALAGQLYGRARAALPFGANPLLWDDGKSTTRRAPGADPTRFPGVNTVFYQMQEGDHLVRSHPAGTPLLEASDLTGGTRETLYAAALAPFGRGFAVFTPDFIDQNRGDGALFARNLLTLLTPASRNPAGGQAAANGAAGAAVSAGLVAVPSSAIENGGAAPAELQRALVSAGAANASSPALPAFGTTPARGTGTATGATTFGGAAPAGAAPEPMVGGGNAGGNAGGAGTGVINAGGAGGAVAVEGGGGAVAVEGGGGAVAVDGAGVAPVDGAVDGAGDEALAGPRAEAVVLLSRGEANSYARLIAAGGESAGAAVNLLRARLFLGRGDVQSAATSLEASAALAPESAEIALWRGMLQIGAAQNRNQPSPVRAELVQSGARDLAQAAGGASLFAAMARADATGAGVGAAGAGATGGARIGGIPVAAIRAWSVRLAQISEVFALEPPLVEQYGQGDSAIIVRAVADDTSLRLVVPGVQVLAGERTTGWHGDGEEVLLFPSPDAYLVYRRALGLNAPTVPLPSGAIGDVVGQRISMIALPSVPFVRRLPNGQVTVLASRNGAASVLARLHSYVLLGAYDEGARSPAWLQLGLENLLNLLIVGTDDGTTTAGQTLNQFAQAGGLLTPDQFRGGLINGPPEQLAIAQAQSAAIMAFFYRVYGAGAVTETVQRLGAGQNIDDALQATTQGDQVELFQNWRQDQFGLGNLPNRG